MSATNFLHQDAERLESPVVRLLEALPELERVIPAEDRALAWRALVAPVAVAPAGPLDLASIARTGGHATLSVVTEGLVLRNTYVRGRAVTEIIGEGDVVETHDDIEPSILSTRTEYVVQRAARIAFLDDRFRAAARRWPALHDVVHAQLARQRRRASTHLAILQLARVEDRITALFSHFADRWGRVTPDGIVIQLPLTHELIGQIVGGRRPTVTLALAELAAAGTLVRGHDGSWLVSRSALAG